MRQIKRYSLIKTLFIYCILTSYTPLSGIASAQEELVYPSPDGRYSASVLALLKAPNSDGESKIVIHTRSGAVIFSKSYESYDGEHGFVVKKASWTEDSQFFVYSLSSSGGHQPWHYPTEFVALSNSKVYSLDDYFGPVTDPNFIVLAPDIVLTAGQKEDSLNETVFSVRLSEFPMTIEKK